MKKDFEPNPDDGSEIELDLTDPVPPRTTSSPAPSTISPARSHWVSFSPVPQSEPPQARRRGLGGAWGLALGLLLLGGGAVLLVRYLPFFEARDERFELKRWEREVELKHGDQYVYHLGAPEGVALSLSCDRVYENNKAVWTCSCLEGGSPKRTVQTQAREPKEAVDIARRARKLCDWPFWADCPPEHWLGCKLLPQ